MDLAFVHGEIEAVEDLPIINRDVEVFDFKKRHLAHLCDTCVRMAFKKFGSVTGETGVFAKTVSIPHFGQSAVFPSSIHAAISRDEKTVTQLKHPQTSFAASSSRLFLL